VGAQLTPRKDGASSATTPIRPAKLGSRNSAEMRVGAQIYCAKRQLASADGAQITALIIPPHMALPQRPKMSRIRISML